MHRRDFLGGLIGAAAMPALASTPVRAQDTPQRVLVAPTNLRAKVRPDQPGWPSAADWERLKAAVGGRLMPGASPFAACGTGDDAACRAARSHRANPFFLQEAGGTVAAGWLDGWEPAPGAQVVAAASVADVVAAVNFARERNLRLVVRGGGHSLTGQSSAPDSLVLWTRGLAGMELHDEFVPRGGEGGELPAQAVSVGAGARWLDVYDFVTARHGRFVQGADETTVSVGGHVQAGGFGSFSKGFGTAAGNLLEAEIVTADGQVRIVNRHREPDLFRAIRGGVGGFGVLTRLTFRTHRLPEQFGLVAQTIRARGDSGFRRLVSAFLRFADENLVTPHWGEEVVVGPDNSLDVAMVFQGLDEDEARAVWRPFWGWLYEHADLLDGASAPRVRMIPARSFRDRAWLSERMPERIVADTRPQARSRDFWWAKDAARIGAFHNARDSVWLPRHLIETGRRDTFAETLFLASRQAPVALQFHKALGGARDWVIEDARETAVHPAVVDAFALAVVTDMQPGRRPGLPGHEPDLQAGRDGAARVRAAISALRRVATGGGAHPPDASFHDPEWQARNWGARYYALLGVKLAVDPGGLFFAHHAAGSEFWSADGFTPAP